MGPTYPHSGLSRGTFLSNLHNHFYETRLRTNNKKYKTYKTWEFAIRNTYYPLLIPYKEKLPYLPPFYSVLSQGTFQTNKRNNFKEIETESPEILIE